MGKGSKGRNRQNRDNEREADEPALDQRSAIARKSLGALRPNTNTAPRSPHFIGKLSLQRSTFKEIKRQFKEQDGDELTCNIAGWKNHDGQGTYLTVELSPPWIRPAPTRGIFDFMDEEDEA